MSKETQGKKGKSFTQETILSSSCSKWRTSWYGESSSVMPRGLWTSCSLHLHLTPWPRQLSQQCFRALLLNSCNLPPELEGESSFKVFWDLQVNARSSLGCTPTNACTCSVTSYCLSACYSRKLHYSCRLLLPLDYTVNWYWQTRFLRVFCVPPSTAFPLRVSLLNSREKYCLKSTAVSWHFSIPSHCPQGIQESTLGKGRCRPQEILVKYNRQLMRCTFVQVQNKKSWTKNLHYRGSRSLFFPPKLTRASNNLHYNEHNVLMLCLTLLLIFTRTHSTALGRPGHVNTQLPPCFCSLCIFTIHKSVQLQCV